jgi:hypothetical protein
MSADVCVELRAVSKPESVPRFAAPDRKSIKGLRFLRPHLGAELATGWVSLMKDLGSIPLGFLS